MQKIGSNGDGKFAVATRREKPKEEEVLGVSVAYFMYLLHRRVLVFCLEHLGNCPQPWYSSISSRSGQIRIFWPYRLFDQRRVDIIDHGIHNRSHIYPPCGIVHFRNTLAT